MKYPTSSEANEWALQLVSAAGKASKNSLGEVSNSYVIGVLTTTIKALLLDKKHSEAKEFMEREIRWMDNLSDSKKAS